MAPPGFSPEGTSYLLFFSSDKIGVSPECRSISINLIVLATSSGPDDFLGSLCLGWLESEALELSEDLEASAGLLYGLVDLGGMTRRTRPTTICRNQCME